MSTRAFSRRLVAVACLALSLSCLLMQWAGAATLTRVTLPDGGVGQVNNSAHIDAMSANGRYVLFGTSATNVVSGDTNGTLDAFVYDRVTRATVRASLGDDGSQPNRDCLGTDITPDGRYVTFDSAAGNLVAGDTNAKTDVFVRDLVGHHTVRVSVTTAGVQTNQNSSWGELSADGRYILFSSMGQLVPADTNATGNLYVRDLVAGTTTLVSVDYDGVASTGGVGSWTMTPDGRYIAFTSGATNLVRGYTFVPETWHLFVCDMMTNTTTVADLSYNGEPSNGHAYLSGLSDDGRYVCFYSQATNLLPDSMAGVTAVYLRDRQTGTTSRVSANSQGMQADGSSNRSAMSGDGRYTAFTSYATNLVPDDTNGAEDVFLRDNVTGAVRRISVSNSGTQTNGPIYDGLHLSYDGLQSAFTSAANNLVAGDSNGKMDGFVYERTPPSIPTSLSISPAAPVCTSDLVAVASGSVDSVETPTYQYEWSKLGGGASGSGSKRTPVGRKELQWGAWQYASITGQLTGVTLMRGDVWRVHALATDGADSSDWTAPVEVTIGDTAPGTPTQLTISPTDPLCTSALTATADGATDIDSADTVSYKYQWMQMTGAASARKSAAARKGGVWGYDSTDGKLSGVTLHRGEVWQVHACATDGTLDSPWSDPVQVTISNSLPTAPTAVTVAPSPTVAAGQALTAAVSGITDADDDPLEYVFQWAKSGDGGLTWEDWSGPTTTTQASTSLPAGTTALGERWKVRAAANDAIAEGQWLESDAVMVSIPGVVRNQPQGSNAGSSWPVIRVGFAQAMNKSLTQAAFSLTVDGSSIPVPGSFVWVGDEMQYYAQGALAPRTTYRATVAATAETATGVAMSAPYSWTFTTNNVPALNSWSPKPAATLNAVVHVAFNQPMNMAATEAAFSVKIAGTSTPVAGSFSWSGNELLFTPSATLTADTIYRAALTTAAKSSADIALGAPFSWDFKTNHGPTVVLNQPQGTNAGPSWPVIRVGFDQPMNGTLTQAAFSLTPNGTTTQVPGFFSWSGNEMRYYVQGALAPLTTYRVTVAATAQSAAGEAMGRPSSWTFRTNNVPSIASWAPKRAVVLNSAVRLSFNQAMNKDLTQGAFSLKVAGSSTPLPGAFSWSGNELIFTPSALLEADTTYRASITTAAQSASGVALGAPFSWDFRTNLGPTVCLNQPQGSSTGGSWPIIRVGFDQPMSKTLTQTAFSITQDGTSTVVPGYFGWANNELKYYVQGALAPLTTYRVTVAATAQAATGALLGTPFTWTFTTNNVPAIASWTPRGTVAANTTVKLTFNQSMDTTLTEGAFSLKAVATSTVVAGAFTWSGNELSFTPSAPLTADTAYRASITTVAQSSAGVALGAAFLWDFKTASAGTGTAMVTAVATETRQGAQLMVTLGSKATVTATIRNLVGRPITVLQPGLLTAGAHTLLWNGKSQSGVKVPAGTYLVEVAASATDGTKTRTLTALRLRR